MWSPSRELKMTGGVFLPSQAKAAESPKEKFCDQASAGPKSWTKEHARWFARRQDPFHDNFQAGARLSRQSFLTQSCTHESSEFQSHAVRPRHQFQAFRAERHRQHRGPSNARVSEMCALLCAISLCSTWWTPGNLHTHQCPKPNVPGHRNQRNCRCDGQACTTLAPSHGRSPHGAC